MLDGDYKIDEELSLFTVDKTDKCYFPVNQVLYDKKGIDTFAHEQNLVISDKETVLIIGCGHAGIVNILSKAEKCRPKFCIGGFRLFNPIFVFLHEEFTTKSLVGCALIGIGTLIMVI